MIQVLALLIGMSFAQDSGKMMDMKGMGPCHADVELHCKGVEKGEGRIMQCLKEKKENLSAECKTHMDSMKKMSEEIRSTCKEDMEKLCGDVKKGHGHKMKCMHKHMSELSEGCKAEMGKMKEMRKGKK